MTTIGRQLAAFATLGIVTAAAGCAGNQPDAKSGTGDSNAAGAGSSSSDKHACGNHDGGSCGAHDPAPKAP